MRKLFWGSLTCGVVLVGSVISTAHFAARHPESVIGRVLNGASYAAIIVNPVGGLAPLVQQVRARDPNAPEALEAVAGDPLPAEPEPVAEQGHGLCAEPDELACKPVAPGPIVETGGAAPIVIAEDDRSGVVSLPMPESLQPCQPAGAHDPACEYPGEVVQVAAPTTMPACHDQEDFEMLPMPKPEPEVLPMPHPEEEQEEMGWMDLNEEQLLKYFQRGLDKQANAGKDDSETPAVEPAKPEWREDCDRHQDYPACPHGGCPSSGKPGTVCPRQPAVNPVKPASHESEDPSEHVSHSTVHKQSIFHDHAFDEEPSKLQPQVDTMEYRSSDLQLYDFGYGPL